MDNGIGVRQRDGFIQSILPTDIETTAPLQQNVRDVLAVELHAVLDVSAGCYGVGGPPRLPLLLLRVSGEADLEVAQCTTGHKALQLLSGQKGRNADTEPNILKPLKKVRVPSRSLL